MPSTISPAKLSRYNLTKVDDRYPFFLFELKEKSSQPSSIFKLHLNLSDTTFSRHHEEIADYFDKLSAGRIINIFKYIKTNAEEIRKSDTYKSYLLLKEVCVLLRNNELKKAQEKTEKIRTIESYCQASKLIGYAEDKTLQKEDINETLELADLELKKAERLIGQAQFTVYLPENVNDAKLSLFCALLQRNLSNRKMEAGAADISDLPLTTFLSFRQEKISPKDKYSNFHDLSERKQKALLNSAKESKLFNTLYNETKAHGEILAVIDDEIKAAKPPVVGGLIAATLSYRGTPVLQHSIDNAIKNLDRINNMHDFLEFKSDNVPSLKEVLSRPNAAAKQQTAWEKIEGIFKRYNVATPSQAPPQQPHRPA